MNRYGTTRVWGCGHPRTPENTQAVGKAGVRCRTCRRKIANAYARRKYHAAKEASAPL